MVFEQTYHAARQAFRLEAKQMGAVLDSVAVEADGQRADGRQREDVEKQRERKTHARSRREQAPHGRGTRDVRAAALGT